MSDADVVHALLRGDRQAAWELIERFTPAVLRYIHYHLPSRLRRVDESLDILLSVSPAFVDRVCGRRWDGPDALHAVLLRLVQDKIARRLRTRKTNPDLHPAGAELLPSLAGDDDPAEEAGGADFLQTVRRKCRAEEWDLLTRRVLLDSSYADVAAALGCRPEAARARVERLLERLRGQIDA